MKIIKGNIWDFHKRGHYIVIPTNGSRNAKGECVMGAGLAKDCKKRFPHLPKMLGTNITNTGNKVYIFPDERIITLPTKHHWRDEKANLGLIQQGAISLAEQMGNKKYEETELVFLPKLGTGCGKLPWGMVEIVISVELSNQFTVVSLD